MINPEKLQSQLSTVFGTEMISFSFQVEQDYFQSSVNLYIDIKVRHLAEMPAYPARLEKFLLKSKTTKVVDKSQHFNGQSKDIVYRFRLYVLDQAGFESELEKFAREIADEEFTKTFEETLKQS